MILGGEHRPTCATAALSFAITAVLAVCVPALASGRPADLDQGDGPLLVLPLNDMSGAVLPLESIRDELVAVLGARGVRVVPSGRMNEVLARVRLRSAAGLDDETGRALRRETGAASVLVTSIDLYTEQAPPRMGIHARLLSIEGPPVRPIWAGLVSLAGEQSPGVFGVGVISDPAELRRRVLDELGDDILRALVRGTSAPTATQRPASQRRFKPRSLFISPETAQIGRVPLKVAVLPFSNHSKRPFAGEILALHVAREVVETGAAELVEPGRVRRVLLDTRVVQEPGISLPQADLMRDLLDADIVIAGTVYEYRDGGPGSAPQIEFSAYAIDTRARKVAWITRSADNGAEAVNFFESGMVRTAPELASEMTKAILRRVVQRPARSGEAR